MKRNLIYAAALALLTTTMSACNNSNSNSNNGNAAAEAAGQGANAALECIMTRTSIRQYQAERTVSRDTIDLLLRAAMAAPTAVNKQPWAFVVVDTREALDTLASHLNRARMLRQAPLAIAVCGDMEKTLDGVARDFWIQDVAAATENMLLAAHALGLGAVWTGVYPNPERVAAVQAALGLPSTIIPLAVVPIGYPAENPAPKDKYQPANIHFGRW